MWIKANDCTPIADGDYRVITKNDRKTTMSYTRKGGWNTFITAGGNLVGQDISDFVIKWDNPLVSRKKIAKVQINID